VRKIQLVALVWLLSMLCSCATVPSRLPDLVDRATEEIDNQTALIVNDLETSLAANQASAKLLGLIGPVIDSLSIHELSATDVESIKRFRKAYPIVAVQLDSSLARAQYVEVHRRNMETLTDALRFSNGYIQKAVDENAQIMSVIRKISSLPQAEKGGK
jgi:hypothetical protein